MSVFPFDENRRDEFAAVWERTVAAIGAAQPAVKLIPGAPVCGLMRDLVPEYPSILVVAGSTGPASAFSWGILIDAAAAAASGDIAAALSNSAPGTEPGSENAVLAVAVFASELAKMAFADLGGDSGWQTTPGWQGLLERGYFVDVPEGQMAPAQGLERLLSPGAKVVMAGMTIQAGEKAGPSLHFLFEPAMVEEVCPVAGSAAATNGGVAKAAAGEALPPGDAGFRVIHGERTPAPGRDQVIGVPPAPRVTARRAAFEPLTERPAHRSPEDIQAGIGLLMDVPLQISVELGRTRRKVRDVMALAPGSVVELDRLAGEPVDVLVNGKLLGKGEVVVINENFAIRITDVVSVAERVQELA